MAQAIRGASGAGSVDVYAVPRDHSLQLDLLLFTLTTDATAGVHMVVVTFTDAQLDAATARIPDWNEAGPTSVLTYTFGRGLSAAACTVTTGMAIEHDLPDTILQPDTVITVTAVNAAGVQIAGDQFSSVVLFGSLFDAVVDDSAALVPLIPGWLPGEAA